MRQAAHHAADELHTLSYDGDAVCVLAEGSRAYRPARTYGAFVPHVER